MAGTNIVNSTRMELLTKHNYDTWRIQAEALLVKSDSWSYVNGDLPKPVLTGTGESLAASQAALNAWVVQDRKAKSDLILSMSPEQLKHIRNCETSSEVWNKLRSVYASQGPMRKATLLEQLLLERMREGDDIRDYLSRFMDIVDKLNALDIDINGDLLSVMLLHSLPSSFDNFCCAIKSRDNLPDVEALMIKVIEEHDSKIHKGESGTSVLYSKQLRPERRTTPNSMSTDRRTDKNEGTSSNPVKYKCGYCKKRGHKAADCYRKRRANAQNANSADDLFHVSEDVIEEFAGNVVTDRRWCLDSGCTSHLCKDSTVFTNSNPHDSGVNLASDATAHVTAKGDVQITFSNGERNRSVTLQNTLLVPTLRTNLLSVFKIVDKKHQVLFTRDRAYVQDSSGNVKMIADRVGNLFYLRNGRNTACTASVETTKIADKWHRRLGHLNWKDMLLMHRNKIVSGLNLKSSDTLPRCDVCAASKLTCNPFPKRDKRSSATLEIVHTDLCGPMRTESRGGARYILTFTDDYTRWTEVYFLKNKSETVSKFEEYKSYVETQTGRKIKALQSDNGKEFCNAAMDNILKKFGIRRRLSAPYTPQQNGVAERKNRTLVESARCMLTESGLPKSFWAEAVATANHVRNRCVTRILGRKTPYEMWTKRRPDVSHMQEFGAKTFVLDKAANKEKFSSKGIEGIFVGYSETAKAYRVWIPSEQKVRITRDIKFMDELGIKVGMQESKGFREMETELKESESKEPKIVAVQDQTPDDGGSFQRIEVEGQGDIAVNPMTNTEIQMRRAPGRPRKILTGKPGRPSKQYQLMPVATNPHESNTSSDSSDEEEQICADAEFAMNATEIHFHQAISGPDKEEWYDAIYSEIRSIVQNDTFDIVARPADRKVIKCRTVLRNKYAPDGTLDRRKARVVAGGYAQRPGVDFFETFAPVASLGSLRTLMALAARSDLKISQIDIESAYLNGKVDTEIFMEMPDLLHEMLRRMIIQEKDQDILKRARSMLREVDKRDTVCRLSKAIYGLRQAGRRWHAELDKALRSVKLTPTNADPCVYVDSSKLTIVLVYVDDILIFYRDRQREDQIKKGLAKFFKVKDLGEPKFCLGFEIRRGGDSIYLSQKSYIREILSRFGMQDCKPVRTPLTSGVKLTKGSDTSNDQEKSFPYKELVGSLMYVALGTRPDIAYAVSALGQFNSCFNKSHWIAAKRVLRYLKGTVDYELVFKRDDTPLKGFADADWGNCTIDRRSYTGFAFVLAGGAVTWKSRKQRTVALSSTEAEYMAMSDAAREALFLTNFLGELGCSDHGSVTIFNDNRGAGQLANNPVFHARSKHIDIRHHFIREVLENHHVDLKYLPTEDMVADVLTKALAAAKHQNCIPGLGLLPSKDRSGSV